MVEIRKGTPADKADIIDFINCVFSQDKFPHDFKAMAPKCYSDEKEGLGAEHYMVVDGGKIKALVAMRIVEMHIGERVLRLGLIGNVSVHYYSRGEGYMKRLMNEAIEDARALGVDMLILNGFRQRYGYFGFEQAGYKVSFTVNTTNLRHTMSEVDISDISFYELNEGMDKEINFAIGLMEKKAAYISREKEDFVKICRSWHQKPRVICSGGEMIGYVVSVDGTYSEIVLSDENELGRVIKALFNEDGVKKTTMSVPPYESERVAFLESFSEDYKIEHVEMVSVLNWKRTLEGLINLKKFAEPIQDTEAIIEVDGVCLSISVKDGEVSVEELCGSRDDALKLSHNEAEKMLFSPMGLIRKSEMLKNIAPLPLFIHAADAF